jgi:hypothetical protein
MLPILLPVQLPVDDRVQAQATKFEGKRACHACRVGIAIKYVLECPQLA